MFKVQKRMCATCIYRPDSTLDIKHLEDQVRDKYPGYFKGYRICHHSKDVCCRGFWQRHKDMFQLGQIAQRLGLVRFVHVDTSKQPVQRSTDGMPVNASKPKNKNTNTQPAKPRRRIVSDTNS